MLVQGWEASGTIKRSHDLEVDRSVVMFCSAYLKMALNRWSATLQELRSKLKHLELGMHLLIETMNITNRFLELQRASKYI